MLFLALGSSIFKKEHEGNALSDASWELILDWIAKDNKALRTVSTPALSFAFVFHLMNLYTLSSLLCCQGAVTACNVVFPCLALSHLLQVMPIMPGCYFRLSSPA